MRLLGAGPGTILGTSRKMPSVVMGWISRFHRWNYLLPGLNDMNLGGKRGSYVIRTKHSANLRFVFGKSPEHTRDAPTNYLMHTESASLESHRMVSSDASCLHPVSAEGKQSLST